MSSWSHKTSRSRQEIEDFINAQKPNIDGIQGSLSHGRDFHVWVRQGDRCSNSYELKHTSNWGTGMAQQLESMLGNNNVKVLSFNLESSPRIWYIEQT